MSKAPKVDLTLVKKLIAELEESLAVAENLYQDSPSKNNDYVVEMSKASGLATGAAIEASMLALDVQAAIKMGASSAPKEDGLKSLLASLKGGGFGGTN
jgi:hypothetical protein